MGAPSITERIRQATPGDAAGVAAIYDPEVANGTASFETEPPGPAEMGQRIQRCLDRGWRWLVAEGEGGAILGYAYLSQFRDRAAYRHSAETSVYVARGLHGRGLGHRLMEALLAEGARAGFRQFVAVIGDSGNAPSIALHRRLGFRPVGTKFGRQLDVVYMQKSLQNFENE